MNISIKKIKQDKYRVPISKLDSTENSGESMTGGYIFSVDRDDQGPESGWSSPYSSDVFYDERPDLNEQMTRHGILGVEMEAAELYNLAARHSVRALAVLTVSDHLQTGDALPSEDRERSFADMVEIALTAAFN